MDDHSRVAYVEAHDDETKKTATEVLRNAVAWFAGRGVVVQRVLSDNGNCYQSRLWKQTCRIWASRPRRRGPIGRRPLGRSSGSTAPLQRDGRSRSSTSPSPPDSRPCQHGSTSTNDPRPHSAIGKVAAPITEMGITV